MLQAGDKAPHFSLQDHRGETRNLEDFAGRTIVLWFYPKADTPG